MRDRERTGRETPQLADDFIVADADYFRAKARQCARLAGSTHDEAAGRTLRSLAEAFEQKADALSDERED
jgi:hypothetical protein